MTATKKKGPRGPRGLPGPPGPAGAPPAPTRWEYYYFDGTDLSMPRAMERMNELGDEGWEVFQLQDEQAVLRFYAKRPKR